MQLEVLNNDEGMYTLTTRIVFLILAAFGFLAVPWKFGQGENRSKSGFVVYRGFVCL